MNTPKEVPNSVSASSRTTRILKGELGIFDSLHSLTHCCYSLFERAQSDNCTTGKSTIGDEKKWNVFMRLDTEEAK